MDDMIAILAARTRATKRDGDYAKDGLLFCGRCHTAKQCRITTPSGKPLVVGCSCKCHDEEYLAERERIAENEARMRIEALRANGIRDKAVHKFTFDAAQMTPILERCMKYVDNWEQVKKNNNGLLFFGPTGNGKTFAAACIVNALIDKGIPAMMTSFPRIINAGFDKSEIVEQLANFPLLVIDDLGTERQSDYALEAVYMVVDERYKSGLPLIVTTNLSMDEMRNPTTMAYQRIYDRVLEMCVPVKFTGESIRKKKTAEKLQLAKEIFS